MWWVSLTRKSLGCFTWFHFPQAFNPPSCNHGHKMARLGGWSGHKSMEGTTSAGSQLGIGLLDFWLSKYDAGQIIYPLETSVFLLVRWVWGSCLGAKDRMTTFPGVPRIVFVYTCCPWVIINSVPFHSRMCPLWKQIVCSLLVTGTLNDTMCLKPALGIQLSFFFPPSVHEKRREIWQDLHYHSLTWSIKASGPSYFMDT